MIQKTNDFVKVQEIRIKIFNKELGLSNNDIFDEDDNVLEQFLITHDEKTVGTFRLRSVNNFYKIERMGILSEYRLHGYGQLALKEIVEYSKKLEKSKIVLDSIFDVRNFYAKSGFLQTGDVYSKVGIPHVKMYLTII